ncbi:MAG: hypothetical protein M1541_16475 [Acidobacteria bacterium]|nr:hypothetical protein [Acidobacteriota bacterium]
MKQVLFIGVVLAASLGAQQHIIEVIPDQDSLDPAAGRVGEIRLFEKWGNGQSYVGLKAPAELDQSVIWTMPAADGSAGQCVRTDGAGVLSWGDCASAAPGPYILLSPPTGGSSATSVPSYVDFYSTFDQYPTDQVPRRTAIIQAAYAGGVWGNEALIFGVGGSDDSRAVPAERMRLTAAGIKLNSLYGDSINLWDGGTADSKYAIGIEGSTLYQKSGNYFRWYIGKDQDDGASESMQLDPSGLMLDGDLTVDGDVKFSRVLGDLIMFWDDGTPEAQYAAGMEGGTLYFRSNGYFRWYLSHPADGGASAVVTLDSEGFKSAKPFMSWDPFPLVVKTPGYAYFPMETDHVAWYKKPGGASYYWRLSDTGYPGGPNDTTLMQLDNNGTLWLIGDLSATNFTFTGAFNGSIHLANIADLNTLAIGSLSGNLDVSRIDNLGTFSISNFTGNLDVSRVANLGTINVGSFAGSLDVSKVANLGSFNIGNFAGVITTQQITDGFLSDLKKFSDDLRPITRVISLPALPNAGYPVNTIVLNQADAKLYKNSNNAWVTVAPSDTITGKLSASDILSVNANTINGQILIGNLANISVSQLQGTLSAAQAGQIDINSFTGTITNLNAGTVNLTGQWQDGQIGSISAGKLTAGAVTLSDFLTVTDNAGKTIKLDTANWLKITDTTSGYQTQVTHGYFTTSAILDSNQRGYFTPGGMAMQSSGSSYITAITAAYASGPSSFLITNGVKPYFQVTVPGGFDVGNTRVNIGASTVIDGTMWKGTMPYYTSDPTLSLSDGQTAFWWDGSDMWLVFKQSGNRFRVAMQSN